MDIETLTKQIGDRWLLLDANFILNSLRNPNQYSPIYKKLNESEIELVTSKVIVLELYKGSDTISHIKEKESLLNDKIGCAVLSVNDNLLDETTLITLAYRKLAPNAGVADLILAGLLKQYSEKMVLLSSNLKDFPQPLFDWESYLNVGLVNKADTYALISFSQKKYENAITGLNKTK